MAQPLYEIFTLYRVNVQTDQFFLGRGWGGGCWVEIPSVPLYLFLTPPPTHTHTHTPTHPHTQIDISRQILSALLKILQKLHKLSPQGTGQKSDILLNGVIFNQI